MNRGEQIEKKGMPPVLKFIDPLKASRQAAKGLKKTIGPLKDTEVKSKKKKERSDSR